MEITGPARGHDLLKTAADPSGTKSLGTWFNCSSGRTPWGTFLTFTGSVSGYQSGLYICRLEARALDGQQGTALVKMAVSR